jgi:hypothetical protein
MSDLGEASLHVICKASVNSNDSAISLLTPIPNGDIREHITLELLRGRMEFEIGVIYEMTIRKLR